MESSIHKCAGGNGASYICKNKKCKVQNPFVCDGWKHCECRIHYHDEETKFIGIKIFLDDMNAINNSQSVKSKTEIDQFFQKISHKFMDFLNQEKEKVYKKIDDVGELTQSLDKSITTSVFIEKQPYEEMSGSFVNLVHRQVKNIKQNKKSEEESKQQIQNYKKEVNEQFSKFVQYVQNYTQKIGSSIIIKKKSSLNSSGVSTKMSSSGPFFLLDQQYEQDIITLKEFINDKQHMILTNAKFRLDSVLTNGAFDGLLGLVLENCNLGDQSWKKFEVFNHRSLKILNVAGNKLTDTGLASIVKAELLSLVEFKGYSNLLTDLGGELIASANWPDLGYINVHSNKISSKGAQAIVKKYNRQLWRLDLDYNSLTDACQSAFTGADWGKLNQIHLCANDFSKPVLKNLHTFFKTTKEIKKVVILVHQ